MRARGFTLVEALMALLLLTVGLLGAGALLLNGLRLHAQALRQTAAVNLVRDMAERIRLNPRAHALYDSRTAPAVEGCETSQACDVAPRAAADLAHFMSSARRLFPGQTTQARVEFLPATGNATPDRYTITLSWRSPEDSRDEYQTVALNLLAQPVAG